MRLKTFETTSMSQALKLVREELGDDAVIVSTSKLPGGKGIKVTAAVDRDENEIISPAKEAKKSTKSSISVLTEARKTAVLRDIEKTLSFHGIPHFLVEKMVETARYIDFTDVISALEKTLALLFQFEDLELEKQEKPIILIGATGVGKTIVAAKIATELSINKIPVTPITIDYKRAGGIEQLRAFTDILKEQLEIPETPAQLKNMLKYTRGSAVIIDTFGINPYDADDVKQLKAFLDVADMEPVLVHPAGGDVNEAEDHADVFFDLGARKMILSKIHTARRLGSVITAANVGRFGYAGISGSSKVSTSIEKIDGKMLAALLLKHKLEKNEARK